MKALREIRRLQKSMNLIIFRLFFQRVVRDVLYDIDLTYRMQKSALKTLQKATKAILITKFESKSK
jgi:histone H3/H4